ncbi:Xylose isomerase, partial [Armadillidium nasatum]
CMCNHSIYLFSFQISDRDLCPDFDNFDETCLAQEEMCNFAYDLQRQTKIRPLYFSCDLFSHPRYCNGAATNPDAHVFAYACAQLKNALEMAKRLGAENFVFYHPRDGYQSLIQRNIFRDVSHLGQLYRMALQYRDKIGYRGQFLIQPKPYDPRRFQYECDAMSVMAMLRQFGVERHFKLYIKPGYSKMMGRPYEHDVYIASAFNMLGMVDASDNWPEIHTTSDVVPYNVRSATYVMKCVMEQGGLQNGGFTLGFKTRREAIEPRDLFHAYILAMDTYARALKNAARMLTDGCFARSIQQRYITYKSSIGERLDKGNCVFEECEDFIRKAGPIKPTTSSYESFENMFNFYVFPPLPH